MQVFNTLKYLTIPAEGFSLPSWFRIELGIFAGRLYFDYREYTALLSWLGIREVVDLQPPVPSSSGSNGLGINQPLKFLVEWLAYRRQTTDILHTPMGYVCQGRALHSTHAFFNSMTTLGDEEDVSSDLGRLQIGNGHVGGGNVGDDDSEWDEGDGGANVFG